MPENLETVTINFYGVGCTVTKGSVDDLLWNQLQQCAKKLNTSVQRAVFDLEFFPILNLPKFDSWHCLNDVYYFSGLLDDPRSVVEIKQSGKKKSKIRFGEILGDVLLFSLYKVNMVNVDEFCDGRSITVVEKEIGMIGRYKFKCLEFNIEKLGFTIRKIPIIPNLTFTIISDISYDGKKLRSSKNDTLVNGNFAIVDNDL